jgi:hypothetical protein
VAYDTYHMYVEAKENDYDIHTGDGQQFVSL